ncbi:MAG: DUF4363 family protein [Candidatus Pelethousia sp.]|nr:DUF4363 family protein [Candidatus Pelethousia sp.]
MTKRTGFPLANAIATILATLLILFLFIIPHRYLTQVTSKIRASAREAEYAILRDDLPAADAAITGMCAVFEEAEQPLKLFLNHEDVDELKSALHASRDLTMIDECGNLLTELQNVLRIVDYWDDTETFNVYNLF